MQKILILIILIVVLIGGFFAFNNYIYNEKQADYPNSPSTDNDVTITPISHATMVLQWAGSVLYTDPVGGVQAFTGQPTPNIVLVTDIHGDHLNVETLEAVVNENTTIVAPQAVADQLSTNLKQKTVVLNNGQSTTQNGFTIQALAMYNLPESPDAYHVKGRGNGYIVEHNDKKVYVAGDTADIPEMRNLQNIDIAFIPMNLPYTMNPKKAADAVLEFKPKQVYPYHFRQPDGFANVEQFKNLVTAGNPDIKVTILDWYPES